MSAAAAWQQGLHTHTDTDGQVAGVQHFCLSIYCQAEARAHLQELVRASVRNSRLQLRQLRGASTRAGLPMQVWLDSPWGSRCDALALVRRLSHTPGVRTVCWQVMPAAVQPTLEARACAAFLTHQHPPERARPALAAPMP